MPGKLRYEYQLVWKREGDKVERKKFFRSVCSAYRFLLRLATDEPWKGCNAHNLNAATFVLAKSLGVPTKTLIDKPIRQVIWDLRLSHKTLKWVRMEARQVLAWHEVGDPLETLRPMSQDAFEARMAERCDLLDKEPTRRWVPEREPHVR